MASGCGCLRVEDLGFLRDFIRNIGGIEKEIRVMEIRERAHIAEMEIPPDIKEERITELAVKTKTMERERKLDEYRRLIEKFPHLCDSASAYLK